MRLLRCLLRCLLRRWPHSLLPLATPLLLSACVALPVIDYSRPIPCAMVTRELMLTVVEMRDAYRCQRADDCLAALALGSALFMASTVVSGSVVIVGNTLHWMESNGRCTNQTLTPPDATAAHL